MLVIISGIAQATLDIQFVAFMNILLDNLCQLAPQNNIMPIGMVRNLCAILQCITTFGGGQTQPCHSDTLFDVTNLGVGTYIAYQHYFVHPTCSYCLLTTSKITELEILTLGRWELTALVNTLAQILDNAIVAIHTGHCLALSHEMGVTILELTCAGNHPPAAPSLSDKRL